MSSPQRKAVYAGSFDPLTNGHLWMIEQGLSLFDHLTVAIGINPEKNYTYGVDKRLKILIIFLLNKNIKLIKITLNKK